MAKHPYDLSSLKALSAFEAAARNRGFKLAADELNVTTAAISHQIKSLEEDLSVSLFDRHRRGVEPTQMGRVLYDATRHGFQHISEAVESIRTESSSGAVSIRATTAVSSLWLTPRLGQFWTEHGNIAVNQIVTDLVSRHEPADLDVIYGPMDRSDPNCEALFTDQIVAMADPNFAARHPADGLSQLAKMPLVHLEVEDTGWMNWQTWFATQGYTGPVAKGVTVNNYTIALQVAQNGAGAVLGWKRLVAPLIEQKRLVQIGEYSVAEAHDFYIRARPNASKRAKLLRDWLVGSA